MTIQEFNYVLNILQVLLWKDNRAVSVNSLVQSKQAWYDLNFSLFWEDWFTDVFNLQTANDFGLTIWALILNVPIFVGGSPDPEGKPIFGFNSDTPVNDNVNFERGNFSNSEGTVRLTTEEKRIVLKLRYFKLISRTSVDDINFALDKVFHDYGAAWVLDGLDMTLTYVFNFAISPRLLYVLLQHDILMHGSGVRIKEVRVIGRPLFGFNDGDVLNTYVNFDNGVVVDG